jgi:hypothetical protein
MYITVLLAISLLILTATTHYEGLRILSTALDREWVKPRRQMLLVIFGIALIHFLEIMFYAVGYWLATDYWGIGEFSGLSAHTFTNFLYFSAEAYATLGLGDIYPIGDIRLLASIEALNGLLLLAWSGSFTYLAMQRLWSRKAQ